MPAIAAPLAVTRPTSNPWESQAAAQLYDRVHNDTDDVDLFLTLASAAGGPVLEVGCGTGRCLIPLIRAGFDTVGLDLSEPMLEILREKLRNEPDEVAHRATPLLQDARDIAIPLRFGMALIGMNSFCHLPTKADQESFSTNVFQHLRPGGLLVIDVFNPGGERLLKPRQLVYKDERTAVREDVVGADYAEQTLEMQTIIESDGGEVNRVDWSMRYSYRFELEHLLEKTGFEIMSVWGDYGRADFRHGAERLILVARKPPDGDAAVVEFMRAAVAEPA